MLCVEDDFLGDIDEVRERGNMADKIDIGSLYSVISNLETYSEQSRWNRLNTFLLFESIIILSWATLFSQDGCKPTFLLVMLSLLGTMLGPFWAVLGNRSSKYQTAMHKVAYELEDNPAIDGFVSKPYHVINSIRETGCKTWIHKLTTSAMIMIWVPLLFSVVFAILLVFSIG
jgi:hypothetical protein